MIKQDDIVTNRPFRVNLNDIDYLDKGPDYTSEYKQLYTLFNKPIKKHLVDVHQHEQLEAILDKVLNVIPEHAKIGTINTIRVDAVEENGELTLPNGTKLTKSTANCLIVKENKRVKSKYQELIAKAREYNQLPEEAKDFFREEVKCGALENGVNEIQKYPWINPWVSMIFVINGTADNGSADGAEEIRNRIRSGEINTLKGFAKVNIITGQVTVAKVQFDKARRETVFWWLEGIVTVSIGPLAKDEVWITDINLNDPRWYDHVKTIEVYDINLNMQAIFDLWEKRILSSSLLLELVSHPIFGDTAAKINAILSAANVSLDGLIPTDGIWYREYLLNCDTERANLSPYHENTLTDPNRGHWELFEEARQLAKSSYQSKESRGEDFAFARAPQLDVHETGVCAIDFGTKSTVVACRQQGERLLRIGTGDYNQAPRKEDYENPTTVYFRDIQSFLSAYEAQEGRPHTKWTDLMVSHQAAEHLYDNIENTGTYYATFSELKQWANDKKRHQILQDEEGRDIELVPYLSMTGYGHDVDPIELYAYYLGLYINNMTNGIYLSYILSFPVNYGKDVQDRLLHSFERGLRKSLPQAILADTELMEDFEVYAGASEPAAYAISAIEQYELEPKTDADEVAYAVFDFGGGTTDFDFGIEKKPDDKRRKFEIHQFGKGGDPYLGGENLLQVIAYETYKDNVDKMRAKGIQIVLPKKCTPFAGGELLVMDLDQASQEAHLNMKVLMKMLRPVWEEHPNFKEPFSEPYTLDMYRKVDGKIKKESLSLKVNVKHLQEVLRYHIQTGITSFMTQLTSEFSNRENVQYPIHIFLAGNSCQSRIAQELFMEALLQRVKESNAATGKDTSGMYRLYAPLGNLIDMQAMYQRFPGEEDKELINTLIGSSLTEVKGRHSTELDKARTGKTGVVFGLLRSRRGGKDVRIVNENVVTLAAGQEENTFPYYLGNEGDNRIFHAIIPLNVPYDTWRSFDWADENKFELYYTEDPRALYDGVRIKEAKQVVCRIDKSDVNEDHVIFIKKVSIDTIEYVVADPNTFKGDATGLNVKTKVLP